MAHRLLLVVIALLLGVCLLLYGADAFSAANPATQQPEKRQKVYTDRVPAYEDTRSLQFYQCFKTPSVLDALFRKHGELPMLNAIDKTSGNRVIITVNPFNDDATLIVTNGPIACPRAFMKNFKLIEDGK